MQQLDEFGVLIGYIVVLGFGATIVITLLALVGYLPRLREKYLRWLFSLVIVELAGAGFWFFNETFKGDECPKCPAPPELVFQPSLPDTGIFLSGLDGEPVQRTELMLGEVSVQTLNETTHLALNSLRSLEPASDGDYLLVKSQRTAGLQLGRIRVNSLSRDIINRTMPMAHHLALGMHYADCLDYPECEQRRNANQAVFHLTWVLRSAQSIDIQQQSQAAIKLFHLQHYLRDCKTLVLLADKINDYRLPENRYPESADVYHTLGESAGLKPEQRSAAYRLSLKSLLSYLSLDRLNSNTDFFRRILDQATDLTRYLGEDDITALLEEIRIGFSSEQESQKARFLSFYTRDNLRQAGDSIEVTFQCPA
ncbi:MAG: hypothetical protein OXC84_03170 [Gammaproteobacteria bacterium]|nr:hypothetical protein [Gammaproteobacteria bacterium]